MSSIGEGFDQRSRRGKTFGKLPRQLRRVLGVLKTLNNCGLRRQKKHIAPSRRGFGFFPILSKLPRMHIASNGCLSVQRSHCGTRKHISRPVSDASVCDAYETKHGRPVGRLALSGASFGASFHFHSAARIFRLRPESRKTNQTKPFRRVGA